MPEADVNATRIHYRLDGPGQGPVVMLSNSLASNLSMWDPQVPPLLEAGYRVLRYDSRGHGQSAVPKGPYSMELLCRDAVALLDRLGLDRVDFCGLSKGGMVGQMLGRHYPDRLKSLLLSSTAARMGPREVWDERIALVREQGMQAVADTTIDRWFTKAGQKRLPAEVARVREMVIDTPVEGFCACCEAIRDMNQLDGLPSIATPTLVAVGEHDPGTTVAHAEEIQQRIPEAKLQVIPDAAHFVNVEQAGAFNRMLLNFLGPAAA